MKQRWYIAFKDLLGIKQKVSQARLLRICCGTWWECYIGEKHGKILRGMNVEWPTKICGCKEGEPTHVTPKIMPLVHYLKNNAQNILKLKIGCLSNGWTKKDVIVELEPKEVVKKMY